MRENGRYPLLSLAYYGTIILMLGLVATLFVVLLGNDIALWVRVTYIIIAVVLALLVVWNIISTISRSPSYLANFIMFIASCATAIVAFILYARTAATGGIVPLANFNYYLHEAGTLVLINLLGIAVYIMGNIIASNGNTNRVTK